MAAHAGRALNLPARPIAAGALILASFTGVALAVQPRAGIAVVVALCYVPLVLLNLRLAIALWLPLIFLEALPAFNAAGKAAGLMLAVAWFGTLGNESRAAMVATIVARHRRLLEVLVLLLVWLSVSILWAEAPGQVLADLWHWFAVALLWLVLATMLDTPRALRLAAGAFVTGALLSVLIGAMTGGLGSDAATRLEGAVGDANFLAAGVVAAIVLAAALAATTTSPLARWACLTAIPLLAAGLVTSQSRGGTIAAVCTVVVALVVFRGRRAHVAAFALLMIAIAGMWFSLSPAAWERVTALDTEGSGRSSLWTVAWRVVEDHPFEGVGLNNFVVVAGDYVREPGVLNRVRLIAEDPHFVHNMYLQVLAESGILGLLLFSLFIVGCLRASLLAARRFAARGDPAMETIARAVFVATISTLISAFFLSSMVDKRMWVLFALGPALLAVASRPRVAAEPQPSPSRVPRRRSTVRPAPVARW
ncbi:MAG TPA: O-antigen ligase family protein [Solirubrobacteraceae bacterium]|nr:O-antigen ligase family protein [Solirubrobacteraceae bacterium]